MHCWRLCPARVIASPLDHWRWRNYSPEGTPRNSSWTTCILFVLKTSIIWEEPINKFINSGSRGIPANSWYECWFTVNNELATNWKLITTVGETFALTQELLYSTGSKILIPDTKLSDSSNYSKNLFIFTGSVSELYFLNCVWQI